MDNSLQDALDSSWKVTNRVHSWICYPIVRLIFALNGISWGKNWMFYGLPIIQKHRQSEIQIGNNFELRSTRRSTPHAPNHPVLLTTMRADAKLVIGNDFGMSGGAICVAEQVLIGDNVTVGTNAIIMDTDFHPADPYERLSDPNRGQTAPVNIEDNVFIGGGSYILRGVTIGSGSIIGVGSVVTRDIPARSIVIGNPARVVGQFKPDV